MDGWSHLANDHLHHPPFVLSFGTSPIPLSLGPCSRPSWPWHPAQGHQRSPQEGHLNQNSCCRNCESVIYRPSDTLQIRNFHLFQLKEFCCYFKVTIIGRYIQSCIYMYMCSLLFFYNFGLIHALKVLNFAMSAQEMAHLCYKDYGNFLLKFCS